MTCPVCLGPISEDNPGVTTRWVERRQSPKHKFRSYRGTILVCLRCDRTHNAGADGAENLFRMRGQTSTDASERHDCARCAVPLLLAPSKLRKTAYCSDRCRVATLRQAQKAVQPAVTHKCDGCGSEMQGRADRKFCSAACRQKAYRAGHSMAVPDHAIVDKATSETRRWWLVVNRIGTNITGMADAIRIVTTLHQGYVPGKDQVPASELLAALDGGIRELQRLRNLVAAATDET